MDNNVHGISYRKDVFHSHLRHVQMHSIKHCVLQINVFGIPTIDAEINYAQILLYNPIVIIYMISTRWDFKYVSGTVRAMIYLIHKIYRQIHA